MDREATLGFGEAAVAAAPALAEKPLRGSGWGAWFGRGRRRRRGCQGGWGPGWGGTWCWWPGEQAARALLRRERLVGEELLCFIALLP